MPYSGLHRRCLQNPSTGYPLYPPQMVCVAAVVYGYARPLAWHLTGTSRRTSAAARECGPATAVAVGGWRHRGMPWPSLGRGVAHQAAVDPSEGAISVFWSYGSTSAGVPSRRAPLCRPSRPACLGRVLRVRGAAGCPASWRCRCQAMRRARSARPGQGATATRTVRAPPRAPLPRPHRPAAVADAVAVPCQR